MSITKARAKQIIQEELHRALRARRLNENYMDEMGGDHMMEDDVYEIDEDAMDDDGMDIGEMYDMDESAYEGAYEGDMHDEGMYEYEMEEGQHDNDQGGQHDNDLGAGDDALMETVRRRLAAARRRR
jgi:hypothetical protein